MKHEFSDPQITSAELTGTMIKPDCVDLIVDTWDGTSATISLTASDIVAMYNELKIGELSK